ncbi:MAG: NAD(+)/NADH kinase [Candidatus Micrarchaeota archaeon]|nr:NAD(+)/NADH kinase [Candidatus Micrarchaeota archaeon]
MELRKVLVIYSDSKTREHKMTLKEVKRVLKKYKIGAVFIKKESEKKKLPRETDLVISVGGDGTFIDASHLIKDDTLIMGVNSDPSSSEGAHTNVTRKDFEKRIKQILDGDFSVEKWTRLEVTINSSKKKEYALNEVYVGASHIYNTSRYSLYVKGTWERQKSSGILISTGCGSTAWYASAGGRPFSKTAKEARFIVREPYCGHLVCGRKINGTVKMGEELKIKSEMRDGIVAIDSFKEYKLPKQKTVKIKVSENPIHVINF